MGQQPRRQRRRRGGTIQDAVRAATLRDMFSGGKPTPQDVGAIAPDLAAVLNAAINQATARPTPKETRTPRRIDPEQLKALGVRADPAALERLSTALAAFENSEKYRNLTEQIAAGEAIVAAFYEGRLELWNRYNREDERSLARVVDALKQLGFERWNKSRVQRCIRLHEQDVFHGGLRQWDLLRATHFLAASLLPLDQQRPLLAEANEKVLSAAAVMATARRLRGELRKAHASSDAVFQSVEVARRVLGAHDHWLAELRRCGLPEAAFARFDSSFDFITRELEALVLTLVDLGADVPVPEMKALQARAKRVATAAEPPK